jgi:hypothetical protein
MKALILSILAFIALAAFVPRAEAGHRHRYVRYYDHCNRPVYGYTYRSYRPAYVYRPRVIYYDHCAPRYSYYSRPRFSVRFGF